MYSVKKLFSIPQRHIFHRSRRGVPFVSAANQADAASVVDEDMKLVVGHVDLVFAHLVPLFRIPGFARGQDIREFTRQDAIGSQALIEAGSNGHLMLVHYLHTEFRLTLEDGKAENRSAVGGAVEKGHIHVLRYFICKMGATGDDLRAVPLAFANACARGDIEIVQCLHRDMGFAVENARSKHHPAISFSSALCLALQRGQLETVRYLHKDMGLGPMDLLAAVKSTRLWGGDDCEGAAMDYVLAALTDGGLK